ncbi:hypothetical protein QJS04_geneDACA014078 [Acorus gramineus]|uniref:Uncharacterized protein n=1 Tax=Acorus gramineus TaxID=55184 RepID=A0AAV9B4B3_ACOGR|nr:hypothetical protein QJS04_geneDACA014078 [Acorus gramineus]
MVPFKKLPIQVSQTWIAFLAAIEDLIIEGKGMEYVVKNSVNSDCDLNCFD